MSFCFFFFFSSRRRHTRYWRDWSSDVCSSDLESISQTVEPEQPRSPARPAPCHDEQIGGADRTLPHRPYGSLLGGVEAAVASNLRNASVRLADYLRAGGPAPNEDQARTTR